MKAGIAKETTVSGDLNIVFVLKSVYRHIFAFQTSTWSIPSFECLCKSQRMKNVRMFMSDAGFDGMKLLVFFLSSSSPSFLHSRKKVHYGIRNANYKRRNKNQISRHKKYRILV